MNKRKLKSIIFKSIKDLKKIIGNEKSLFVALNGGSEKAFEIEIAFILQKKLEKEYTVYMQDNRADIVIKPTKGNTDSNEMIIELGHYTLNQSPILELKKFKPYTDIVKRQNQCKKDIFHIMIVEEISHIGEGNEIRKFKYGYRIKSSLKDYKALYKKMEKQIDFECKRTDFNFEDDKYRINTTIFLSNKKGGWNCNVH
jgi:hypothetical protein